MQWTSLYLYIMKYIIIAISGYLIGAISPSYFLAKILKGIDIREHGDHNAGTLNTLHVLGFFPAFITALFDLTKGLIVALLAYYLHIPYPYNFLFAYIAVLGHIFPFYLKFKGGQGAATAIGIILYFLTVFIKRGIFPIEALIILAILVLVVLYITKNGEIIGISTIPLLMFFTVYFAQGSLESLIFSIFTLHILGVNFYNIKRKNLRLKEETIQRIKWSRFFARPFAVLLIIIYFLTSRKSILLLSGSIALFFIALDLVRLSKKRVNETIMQSLSFLFKKKEERTFSSMTHFMVAAFLSFTLFPREIACASVLFPIFGDMFAKLFGMEFGRVRILEKTLEGTLAYVTFSITAGYIYHLFVGFPFYIIIVGALAAALAEISPWKMDDNLSGALVSGTVMYLFFIL